MVGGSAAGRREGRHVGNEVCWPQHVSPPGLGSTTPSPGPARRGAQQDRASGRRPASCGAHPPARGCVDDALCPVLGQQCTEGIPAGCGGWGLWGEWVRARSVPGPGHAGSQFTMRAKGSSASAGTAVRNRRARLFGKPRGVSGARGAAAARRQSALGRHCEAAHGSGGSVLFTQTPFPPTGCCAPAAVAPPSPSPSPPAPAAPAPCSPLSAKGSEDSRRCATGPGMGRGGRDRQRPTAG